MGMWPRVCEHQVAGAQHHFVSTFVPFHKVLTAVQNGSVAGQ